MNEPVERTLEKAIQYELEKQIKHIIDEEAVAAGKRVEERVRMMTGEVATKVFNHVHFERFGPDLRITVRIPEPEPRERPDYPRAHR